jgi:hypothetical protein
MIESVCDTVAAYYWLWIILGTAVALTHPAIFAGMTSSSYSIGLFCIMISMGFTISRSDFQQALCKPRAPHPPTSVPLTPSLAPAPPPGWLFKHTGGRSKADRVQCAWRGGGAQCRC